MLVFALEMLMKDLVQDVVVNGLEQLAKLLSVISDRSLTSNGTCMHKGDSKEC